MITKWPTRIVKISTLVDHPENPRVPISEDEEFHASLKGSLDAFGYAQHIIWNERTGYVVSGHQRLQLLREAGETEVEVIAVDYDNDTERAALLAFNKIHGRFKDKELADLLARLDKDMKARTGFSGDEIRRLLRAMAMRSRDPNDVPETPTPVTRPGDLIVLGDHRLLCGDSTERDNVARLMDGETATMIFTDPPYNCNYGASMAPSKQSRKRVPSTFAGGGSARTAARSPTTTCPPRRGASSASSCTRSTRSSAAATSINGEHPARTACAPAHGWWRRVAIGQPR